MIKVSEQSTPEYIWVKDIIRGTTVDGAGIRTAIYSSGCPIQCEGCQVPHAWKISTGTKTKVRELVDICIEENLPVSFLGGEPFYQAPGFTELARRLSECSIPIWSYSGYEWEELVEYEGTKYMLQFLEVLVDGEFKRDLLAPDLRFVGSSNQRVIDVQKSLKQGKVVLWESVFDSI